MVRNQRDSTDTISPAFTVTNSEAITSFNADTTTDTIQNNAIAYIFQTLGDQGIMNTVVS